LLFDNIVLRYCIPILATPLVPPLRTAFQLDLELVDWRVLDLGASVKTAIDGAVRALCEGDLAAGRRAQVAGAHIRRQRIDIEERIMQLIATQQPAASDLRRLVAALHVMTDLERIGGYAAGIGRICVTIGHQPREELVAGVVDMADRAVAMLERALDALARRDAAAAQAVALEDDAVDVCYRQLSAQVLAHMVEDASLITEGTQLLRVAHKLERVADHVQNVCERTNFVVTGTSTLKRHANDDERGLPG
jgi:phosphate transport system protein